MVFLLHGHAHRLEQCLDGWLRPALGQGEAEGQKRGGRFLVVPMGPEEAGAHPLVSMQAEVVRGIDDDPQRAGALPSDASAGREEGLRE